MSELTECKCCGGSGKEIDDISYGAQIARLRKQAKLSVRAAAEYLHLSHSYLSQLERGQRRWSPAMFERFKTRLENFRPKKQPTPKP